jgi:hypothetical protein
MAQADMPQTSNNCPRRGSTFASVVELLEHQKNCKLSGKQPKARQKTRRLKRIWSSKIDSRPLTISRLASGAIRLLRTLSGNDLAFPSIELVNAASRIS